MSNLMPFRWQRVVALFFLEGNGAGPIQMLKHILLDPQARFWVLF